MDRPGWFDDGLFPYESRFVEAGGARVHYVDEGEGPVLLLLHGNPTWSFLYRHVIRELRGDFRCVAPDYPGFGLSTAPRGYAFTAVEHSRVVEAFVDALDLNSITMMVQDWGGPIGLGMAGRRRDRFRALVIGNTWAWPATGDRATVRFAKLMGSKPAGFLIKRFNFFVNGVMPRGVRRTKLSKAVLDMYRGPFPTPESRIPTHVFPAQILDATPYLAEVEAGLGRLAHLPALIVWGDADVAFKDRHRERWEATFPQHHTVILEGAGHYIQEDAGEEIAAAISTWWPGRPVGD